LPITDANTDVFALLKPQLKDNEVHFPLIIYATLTNGIITQVTNERADCDMFGMYCI